MSEKSGSAQTEFARTKTTYQQCSSHNEPRNLICEQTECRSSLICVVCQHQQHSGHSVVLAKRAVESSLQSIKGSPLADSIKQIGESINIQNQAEMECKFALKQLELVQQAFRRAIRDIQNEIKSYYQLLKQSAESVNHCLAYSPSAGGAIDEVLVSKLSKANKYSAVQFDIQLAQTRKFFQANTQSITDQIQGWTKLYKSDRNNPFSWLTHEAIEASGAKVTSKGMVAYKLALLDWSLSASSKKTIKFLVEKDSHSWITLGLCNKNIAEENKYSFKHTSSCHGVYMVSSSGACWTTNKPQQNNVFKSFKFTKGDTIKVHLDFAKSRVHFTKNNSNLPSDQFEMDVDLKQGAANDFRFAVAFYYANDQVKVVP